MDLSDIQFPLRHKNGHYLGMTTSREQDWCREYTSNTFCGNGALLELGCLFGSLSIPLAEGLATAVETGRIEAKQALLHSYDLFYWHKSMFGIVKGTPLEGRIKEGDWFVDVYRHNTEHLKQFINLTWGDLGKEKWSGGPIEFLLLDCLKYDQITNNVIRHFFPSTQPGLSRLGHQDYFHFYEWWTHLITFEQRDLLEIEEEIPQSGMLILKVKEDLNPYCAAYDPNREFKNTSPESIEAAYEWNYSVTSSKSHDSLKAANIWAYVCINRLDLAKRLMTDCQDQYQQSPAFKMLQRYMITQGIEL